MYDKITIAVVTFHKDFLLLDRFLKSVIKFWNLSQIDSIKIILNDEVTHLPTLEKIVQKISDNVKIDLICPKDSNYVKVFGDTSKIVFDWHSQQLYKCLISDIINTEWYILHDCKDYYVSPVDIQDCFTSTGQAYMRINQHREGFNGAMLPTSHQGCGPFSLAFETSYSLFGLDSRNYILSRFSFITPFFVKTQYMRDMVSDLRRKLDTMFQFLFSIHLDGQCFVTEFLLYSAYCAKLNNYKDYIDFKNNEKYYQTVKCSKDLRI